MTIPPTKLPPAVYARTVFLGDSITDGNTYPMIVRSALAGAGLPAMLAINAGIGGDTAEQMLARLERDVLPHRPTLVTWSAGGNDCARKVTPERYEAALRGILNRLCGAEIPVMLLVPLNLPREGRPKSVIEEYEQIVRRLADEYQLRVAEINARMREDLSAGHEQQAPDGHPNYTGQRNMARAVLDAMGYAGVALPARADCALQPGVITPWQMRPVAPSEAPLTAETVAAVVPDAGWVTVNLPEAEPLTADEDLWKDDCRRQGAAVWTKMKVGGETDKYLGVATIESPAVRTVEFHTGANLGKVWLNGQLIYENRWQHGWHLGRESVSAELQAGANTVVIETEDIFFLSVSEEGYWG